MELLDTPVDILETIRPVPCTLVWYMSVLRKSEMTEPTS
jgi:hypothetical protein